MSGTRGSLGFGSARRHAMLRTARWMVMAGDHRHLEGSKISRQILAAVELDVVVWMFGW